jgi:hypothetical protein
MTIYFAPENINMKESKEKILEASGLFLGEKEHFVVRRFPGSAS